MVATHFDSLFIINLPPVHESIQQNYSINTLLAYHISQILITLLLHCVSSFLEVHWLHYTPLYSFMDQPGLVPMLEVTGSSSSYSGELCVAVPQAMEGLQGASPPPFLAKICELVDDPRTNHVVSWSKGNNSFVIWDPDSFATELLPKYFKHSNLSSFIRQLNTYVSIIFFKLYKVNPKVFFLSCLWFTVLH